MLPQASRPGALDGLTILRYGHAYGTRGGMEQYLSDLNGILSERSRLKIVQIQLTSEAKRVGRTERPLGRGLYEEISLFVDKASHEHAVHDDQGRNGLGQRWKAWLGSRVLLAPGIYERVTRPLLRRRRVPRRSGEPDAAGEAVREVHRRTPLDLICLHSAGGADASQVLDVAEQEAIPVVYIHHFSNDRLSGLSLRSQIDRMSGVAGVCAVDAPRYLSDRFRNVSDGIDTEFFRREKARPLGRSFCGPVIFLPARLTPSKGQGDLIRAIGCLKRRGLACHLVLAGRTESEAYVEELRRLIQEEGVADRVELIAPLGPEDLRDWFGAAAVLGFPTYHHEGLGRISVEAQAMKIPPVVYRIGGTPESLEDGISGFLIDLGDQEKLCKALERLLCDQELRSRMGAAGRDFAERNFGLTALAERHERFILSVVGAGVGAVSKSAAWSPV